MSGENSQAVVQKPKYKNPLPSGNELVRMLEATGVPVAIEAVARHAGLKGPKAIAALKTRLAEMVTSGRIMKNRRSEYCLVSKIGGITGKVQAHPDGFGFLIPEDGSEDLFVPFHEMRQLLDGDRILARVAGSSRQGKRKVAIVEILERGKKVIVGRFKREHGVSFVVEQAARSPHNFLVAKHHTGDAQPGQMVKLQIVDYPGKNSEAYGKIVDVLGEPSDPGMATTLAIEAFEIPDGFPDAVIKQSASWGDEVREDDKANRVDLRKTPLVTIDGADARDFDDAVFAEPTEQGWRLVVAIADVSQYVQVGDAIDQQAIKRSTSVYFPDRVVPMLPESLSNGLCSLNPNVDRLCMVADMHVSTAGKVFRTKFYKGVMRSHARLTYNQVDAAITDKDPEALKLVEPVLPQLETLYELYAAFSKARKKRGSLELEIPEARIQMGEDGHIDKIAVLHRNDAHKLIEECMIAANVEAGKYLHKNKMPTLYRVHEGPDPDRFEELRVLLQQLDIPVATEVQAKPGEMNHILRELAKRPDFQVMATAVLRTMSRAVYQPEKVGHFGLALETYAHFTSPIRRYPDLLVHRGIQHIVEGGKPANFRYSIDDMDALGRSTSMCEKRADDATRHVEARYKCLYIEEHVGDEFDGVITGVTHFGIFVTLGDLFVEGLVHVTGLNNDYYQLEHGGLQLAGERTGKTFGLGDEIKVRVTRVDVEDAKIDLELVQNEEDSSGGKQTVWEAAAKNRRSNTRKPKGGKRR
ncbi:MAG: ribonuclease R [Gammaproteobacteria bacterium]|nr:ribonuclease R [Gammaproteobacteria bacterium]